MNKELIEQAAREYAEENSWYPGETSYESDIRAMEESFADAFKSGAEWQQKQSPWVSVKERLPKEDELVLCRMVSNGAIVSGYVFVSPDNYACVSTSPDFEFDDYGGYVCDMWMPIPKFNE